MGRRGTVASPHYGASAERGSEDIRRSGGFVLFSEPNQSGSGGRHVEFGVALGLGKRLIVVGGVENLFQMMGQVEVVPTWRDACVVLTA